MHRYTPKRLEDRDQPYEASQIISSPSEASPTTSRRMPFRQPLDDRSEGRSRGSAYDNYPDKRAEVNVTRSDLRYTTIGGSYRTGPQSLYFSDRSQRTSNPAQNDGYPGPRGDCISNDVVDRRWRYAEDYQTSPTISSGDYQTSTCSLHLTTVSPAGGIRLGPGLTVVRVISSFTTSCLR
jgi:hypothetical protein